MNNRPASEVSNPHSRELAIPRPLPPCGIRTSPYIDHWVLQLQGVAPERIDDPDQMLATLKTVAENLHLTRVSEHSHYFSPGVSTVLILSESHLSAHTWPELEYMHVDIVTCVKKLTGPALDRAFRDAFDPAELQSIRLDYTSRA